MDFKKQLATVITCSLFISCASQLYIPTENINSVSIENLKEGRELYSKNCSSCHQLYMPNQYDAATWKHNLDEMQARAKITDYQKKLVYEYLVNAPK